MEDSPVQQVIISLIILLLMGYVAYNIYIIELQKMFKGENNIRKEIDIIEGIYDFRNANEWKYNTNNKLHNNYADIRPSINQEGGAEYSYNFWVYIDNNKLYDIIKKESGNSGSDIALIFKGEKIYYYNTKDNYNCSSYYGHENILPTILTKNPLIRLNTDGSKSAIVVDYNNILSPDSYQNNSKYVECKNLENKTLFKDKNKNLLGVWDINIDKKWFMISIVMKEVADSNNILSNNRALCKIYLNGMIVFDNKIETKYRGVKAYNLSEDNTVYDVYAATHKDNKSPLYINPQLHDVIKNKDSIKMQFFDTSKINEEHILKIGDIKYFNYAINTDIIQSIYNRGLNKKKAVKKEVVVEDKNMMLSQEDLENNEIKQL